MDFEQQVKEAYKNAKVENKKKVIALTAGIVAGVGMLVFFLYITVTIKSKNNNLINEMQAYREKAERQIDYLSTELEEARSTLETKSTKLEETTIENIGLREEVKRIDILLEELEKAYAEIDQSQEKIRLMTAANNDLSR